MDDSKNQQLQILKELSRRFKNYQSCKLPWVIDVQYQSISTFMAYLPWFLGKGESGNTKHKLKHHFYNEKPILVLVNCLESQYRLQTVFNSAAILTRPDVTGSYSTYTMPTKLLRGKLPYHYDIILAGTHYYKVFSRAYFSAVVIFESNYLDSKIQLDISKKFSSIFILSIRTVLDPRTAEDKMIKPMLACRLYTDLSLVYREDVDVLPDSVDGKLQDKECEVKICKSNQEKEVDSTVYDILGDISSNESTLSQESITEDIQDQENIDIKTPSTHYTKKTCSCKLEPAQQHELRLNTTSRIPNCRPKWKCATFLKTFILQIKEKRKQRKVKTSSIFSECGKNEKKEIKSISQARWKLIKFKIDLKQKIKRRLRKCPKLSQCMGAK